MDTKQLEAIRIAEWLEGIRGNTWPSYIPQEAAAELRRLQSENEQLRAGYDAARQEIASLRAQPYDQQAMGLCHACGWKGVIDYPDGPVCVACEHDKTLPPQPTAQAQHPDDEAVPEATPAQVVPAPGVEAVSEREFKQFLSDVLTAAGLVTHGKKCKDLGRRLGEMSMRLLTAPKTAAAPVQAGEYPAGTGNPEADRIIGRLASSDPDFDDCADAVALIHKLVAEIKGPDGFDTWKDAAIAARAARGAAQAAPVDASVLRDAERWMKLEAEAVRGYVGFNDIWYESAEDLRHGVDQLPATYAARAAQKDTND